jgi:hypothetical protein
MPLKRCTLPTFKEETMRKPCGEGKMLFVSCKRKAMELLGVEVWKRQTIQEASRSAWLEVSRCVDEARLAYEDAQRRYSDHAKYCDACVGDLPQFFLLSAPQSATYSRHRGITQLDQATMTSGIDRARFPGIEPTRA